MKRTDIQVGRSYRRTYANGTVAIRTVTGDADTRGNKDQDTVSYRVIAGVGVGRELVMTRHAFAKWAHAEDVPGA